MSEGPSGERRLQMTLPARDKAIPELVEFVCVHAREMLFEEKRITEIRLALEEALANIVRFACPQGSEEISITCAAHDSGALLLDIVDSGVPFNMLAASTFPETTDFADPDRIPPTKRMKKGIKNIEYRRDGGKRKNIMAWVISR